MIDFCLKSNCFVTLFVAAVLLRNESYVMQLWLAKNIPDCSSPFLCSSDVVDCSCTLSAILSKCIFSTAFEILMYNNDIMQIIYFH